MLVSQERKCPVVAMPKMCKEMVSVDSLEDFFLIQTPSPYLVYTSNTKANVNIFISETSELQPTLYCSI